MEAGMTGPDEEELIMRLQQGDETAFQALCDQCVAELERRIGKQLPEALLRKVAVSDVLQDAYLVALRRLGDFEGDSDVAFRSWLAQIVDLKVREALRQYLGTQKREIGREVSVDDAVLARREGVPSPSQMAAAGELGEAVRRAWDRLRPDDREVLWLLQEEGLSFAEAAERMGRSEVATRKLYGRALSRFATLLEQRDHA
jgi:RNA polymerase sigma-70 factor (ECF subfamily)